MNKPEFFAAAPAWMKEAYYKEPAVNRAVCECMLLEMSIEATAWKVAEALYSDVKGWREVAIAAYEPRGPLGSAQPYMQNGQSTFNV